MTETKEKAKVDRPVDRHEAVDLSEFDKVGETVGKTIYANGTTGERVAVPKT